MSKELRASAKCLSESREGFTEIYIDYHWIITIIYNAHREKGLSTFWYDGMLVIAKQVASNKSYLLLKMQT